LSATNQKIEVVANFYDDFVEILRTELAEHGHPASPDDSPKDIHRRYLNLLKRLISRTPRRTHVPREFKCPAEHQSAVDEIIRKATQGDDLNPYLSKSIAKDADFTDLALNYWGMHHLHLGSELDADGRFIKRTRLLLFARVTESDFYLIGIFDHKTDWGDRRILEILHANWPDSIEGFRLRGVHGLDTLPTSADHLHMQKKHLNLPLQLSDGAVYVPFGSGITGSGLSPDVVIRADIEAARIWNLEQLAKNNAPLLVAKAQEKGHSIGPPLHLKLMRGEDGGLLAIETNSGVTFKLTLPPLPP
jgi:hypothetical protein